MIDNKKFYEADEVKGSYMEVALQDVERNEYIYWVDLSKLPEGEDEWDWSIERAMKHHKELGLPVIPEEPEDFDIDHEPYTGANEPFSRLEHEFVFVR